MGLIPVFTPGGVYGKGRWGGVSYDYRDEFTTDRAAGAIDGTAVEPADGSTTRTVTDAGSDATIVDRWLRLETGAIGNPGYWLNVAISREAGMAAVTKYRPLTKNTSVAGWDNDKAGNPRHAFFFGSSNLSVFDNNKAPIIGDYSADQEYDLTVILRSNGAHYFIRGGSEYPEQTLVWSVVSTTLTPLYPYLSGGAARGRYAYIRIPTERWLPTPLVSDGFSSWGSSDGLGHLEGAAALGAGGSGVAWADDVGTWVASGTANASALDGGEAIATASAALNVNAEVTPTRAGGEVGVIVRYVDDSNYVVALHDGTDLILRKVVAGTPAAVASYTGVIGDIEIHCHGTSFMVFLAGTRRINSTISDAVLQTGTAVGLYTTNTGNTFDNLEVWSRT